VQGRESRGAAVYRIRSHFATMSSRLVRKNRIRPQVPARNPRANPLPFLMTEAARRVAPTMTSHWSSRVVYVAAELLVMSSPEQSWKFFPEFIVKAP
jgi:hypothetical protein